VRQKGSLKFLLVKIVRRFANFDEHLDGRPHLRLLNKLSIALISDFIHQKWNETSQNLDIHNDVVLELRILHILNEGQVKFGHIVFVHVKKNVPDHHKALLYFFPQTIQLPQELIVMCKGYLFGDGLQKFGCGLFDPIVQHLAMLVENQAVSGAIQFFVTEGTRLFIVNLIDGVLDCLPVLLSLLTLHVCISHFISIYEEFVGG